MRKKDSEKGGEEMRGIVSFKRICKKQSKRKQRRQELVIRKRLCKGEAGKVKRRIRW